MSKISKTANRSKILHPSKTINSQSYINDISDQGLINLQYAINERTAKDIAEKLNTEHVKYLCTYLKEHIIEDENTMKEVVKQALIHRQILNMKEFTEVIEKAEEIVKDMKVSLDEMYKLMSEDDTPRENTEPPVGKNKADEIEEKLKKEMEKTTPKQAQEEETETPEETKTELEEEKEN